MPQARTRTSTSAGFGRGGGTSRISTPCPVSTAAFMSAFLFILCASGEAGERKSYAISPLERKNEESREAAASFQPDTGLAVGPVEVGIRPDDYIVLTVPD